MAAAHPADCSSGDGWRVQPSLWNVSCAGYQRNRSTASHGPLPRDGGRANCSAKCESRAFVARASAIATDMLGTTVPSRDGARPDYGWGTHRDNNSRSRSMVEPRVFYLPAIQFGSGASTSPHCAQICLRSTPVSSPRLVSSLLPR